MKDILMIQATVFFTGIGKLGLKMRSCVK